MENGALQRKMIMIKLKEIIDLKISKNLMK